MEARLLISSGTGLTLALIALAVGIALGQPSPRQPGPGLVATQAVIIECPPPPIQTGAGGPGC